MAFTTKDTFTFDFTAQSDYPNWTPAQTKTNLNARSEEMRVAFNTVVNLLNAATDGASGADNVAMTPIAAIGSQDDVQSVVEALITRLQAVTVSSSGAKLIGVESITGLTGNDVQTLLVALKTLVDGYNSVQSSALNTHKLSTDHNGLYYTESESDARYATSQEVQDVVLGQIPDGSLGVVKLSFDPATQVELDVVSNNISTHKIDYIHHAPSSIGTAGQFLSVNSGATATEWKTVSLSDGAWEKITDTTLTSISSQVDLLISSGYKELRLSILARGTDINDPIILIRFNNDSGLNYYNGNTTAVGNCSLASVATRSSYNFSYNIVNISNIADKWKMLLGEGNFQGKVAAILTKSGSWANTTDEIATISLIPSIDSFDIGSRFTLWGYK